MKYWSWFIVLLFLLHDGIKVMMLLCRYLGHIGDTVLIPNLQFETKSGNKNPENIYKGNLI